MSSTLRDIAEQLKSDDSKKKVQLIYAFNGVGKTRLSREFKELISSKKKTETETETEEKKIKIIYYNAFTEDLFQWDNDLEDDIKRKINIQPNEFTQWILKEQGKESDIIHHFQRYTNDKLTPRFNDDYTEITFAINAGNDEQIDNIKISRGEENCLIWAVFYSLFEQIIQELNITEAKDRSTDQFDNLEYIFIDDPVSSLDENHLIELAVNIATLIRSSENKQLKFIITTHNPLFYNVLFNELNPKTNIGYMLSKDINGTFNLIEKKGDSNKSFSYHLFLKQTIEEAINTDTIQRYHFTLLRNLYEKTANFLGYNGWKELLPDDKQNYYNRIIQFTSHSTLSNEVVAEPTDKEKKIVTHLFKNLIDSKYHKKEDNDIK